MLINCKNRFINVKCKKITSLEWIDKNKRAINTEAGYGGRHAARVKAGGSGGICADDP